MFIGTSLKALPMILRKIWNAVKELTSRNVKFIPPEIQIDDVKVFWSKPR